MEWLQGDGAQRSLEDWRALVGSLERRGALYFAYDAAMQGLAEPAFADDLWLRHRAALALARAGATEAAEDAFSSLRLEAHLQDPEVASLSARLKKDRALRAPAADRQRALVGAAAAYQAIHARSADYYPAINAATLWLLAGELERAHALAGEVLTATASATPDSPLAQYYVDATEAEAHLVLGDADAAAQAVERAVRHAGTDLSARATTRKQLRLVAIRQGFSDQLLAPLAPPAVVHYCGHMLAIGDGHGRLRPADVPALTQAVRAVVERLAPGAAYGSLCSGADMLFVEALLARGAEVVAVLPFALDDFVRTTVAPAGPAWLDRFWRIHAALAADNRIVMATDDDYVGDENLFLYAHEFAMGLALLRAQHIDAHVEQLCVWDGRASSSFAGTHAVRELWLHTGHAQTNVAWQASGAATDDSAPTRVAGADGRGRRALLFGDFKGFSKLPDRLLPVYVEKVLGAVEKVLQRYPVEVCNTWGDAVYLVLEDPAQAARCALELQSAVRHIDWDGLGFASPLQLRLGGHYGPVYRAYDPILKADTYVGAHVSRAARIEPVTPPGGVYVTEQFATKLALSYAESFDCEYVGVRDLPKSYGRLPLNLVRERNPQD